MLYKRKGIVILTLKRIFASHELHKACLRDVFVVLRRRHDFHEVGGRHAEHGEEHVCVDGCGRRTWLRMGGQGLQRTRRLHLSSA